MEDESILLKIHRQFTHNEAMAELFKIIKSLEFEVGILTSERDELKYELNKVRNSFEKDGTKTKKAWLKDDLIALMAEQQKTTEKHFKQTMKSLSDWQARYFNLLAKMPNSEQSVKGSDTTEAK